MSTRYVWGKYNISTTTDTKEESIYKYRLDPVKPNNYEVFGYTGDDYELSGGKFSLVKPKELKYGYYSTQRYFAFNKTGNTTLFKLDNGSRWVTSDEDYNDIPFDEGPTKYEYLVTSNGGATRYENYTKYTIVSVQSQGSYVSDASNGSSSKYPKNGVSGSYWYVSKGNDNIDPASVTYDTNQVLTKPVTIQATASTGNKYGGTITYDYQVCINGTNWIDVGSSTELTMNYTIPETATQFQARVRARDNMGFTSSTWVTGPLATVRAPWVHHRLHRKNAQQVYDLVHFMTSAENVVHNNTSNVQATIDNIKQRLGLS